MRHFAAVAALAMAGAPCAAAAQGIQALVDDLARRPPLARAQLGVSVVEVSSGAIVASHLASSEFAPASNIKLLLAAAVLDTLGPNFGFRTELEQRGSVHGGTLDGDLILVGGGDPMLSRADLSGAVAAVRAARITAVAGTALGDDTLFDRQRYAAGWSWEDFPFYYQAPIEALALDEGTVQVTVSPGASVGAPARVVASSGYMGLAVTAVTTAAGSMDDADCFRSPGGRLITIVGHMPLEATADHLPCAVDDNTDYTVTTFEELLAEAGVSTGASPRGPPIPRSPLDTADRVPAALPSPTPRVLWVHHSQPLSTLLHRMLVESDNFIADMCLKMLAVRSRRERGTFEGGAKVEKAFMRRLGLDPETLDGQDGSGLSPDDRITPTDLTAVLRYEAKAPHFGEFYSALARAGQDGTLANRMLGSAAVGRVRAKTGTMRHVSALSGYVQTRHHGLVAFSIVINGAMGKPDAYEAIEDQIAEALATI